MNREIEVHIDLDGSPHLVGRLWARANKGRESASFAYEASWLASPLRFSIEPALRLGTGTFHTQQGRSLFGALGDSAPDRWGRMLMKRLERRLAGQKGHATRTLLEVDYLLMVDDAVRPGALRFKVAGSETFLASGNDRIPPLVFLPQLLSASERVVADKESDEDLRLLLAPGSSLGGARPKAAVRDTQGHLLIAKFPQAGDEYSIERWSFLTLELARKAGITVPPCRLVEVNGSSVLLVDRFDRQGAARIPFLSAMSMLGAADGESHSYLEIADALRQYGASPEQDHRELWRRILFNVLVSNVDDHLRNHGFLYDTAPRGWRLSPAYDLNPAPPDVKPRYLTTLINEQDNEADFRLVVSTGDYYGLSKDDMKQIITETVAAISGWRAAASEIKVPHREIERMAGAFEHPAAEEAHQFVK
jgi:serine/threonine-protein kinase HipA